MLECIACERTALVNQIKIDEQNNLNDLPHLLYYLNNHENLVSTVKEEGMWNSCAFMSRYMDTESISFQMDIQQNCHPNTDSQKWSILQINEIILQQ